MISTAYKINDLGLLTKYSASTATAINNSGQLIGYYSRNTANEETNDEHHCFLWKTLEVKEMNGFSVCDINDFGEVIGCSLEDNDDEQIWQTKFKVMGYLYIAQEKFRLSVPADTVLSSPKSINNQGQIAGVIQTSYSMRRTACTWSGERLETLAVSDGFLSSEASAINDQGQIVGSQKQISKGVLLSEAVMWEGGKVLRIGNPPGCSESIATGINNSGQVLVYGFDRMKQRVTNRRAFIWTEGQIQELSMLRQGKDAHTSANCLNDHAQVVGNSLIKRGKLHACLWQHGSVFDLNNLVDKDTEWELISAQSINNYGQIACNGIYQGRVHAVMLTPEVS